MASLCEKHIAELLWDWADFPTLVPSYIYRLLTAVTDNLRSIHESIKAIATAVTISLIPYRVPQKVTEMESWATGRAAVHRQFQ